MIKSFKDKKKLKKQTEFTFKTLTLGMVETP
jgi:hypothetical protein